MSLHVVAGAGSTGSRVALILAAEGDRVRLVSRRGLGPDHPLIELVVGDTTDADRMTSLTDGADSIINTSWPPYDSWPMGFPPIAAGVLSAAERTGAGYVSLSNTYGYGLVDGAFTEEMPMAPISVKGAVRAQMWLDALAAHEAGRVRVTEVRASGYLGANAGSPFSLVVLPNLLKGAPAAFPGDLDAPRTWSYLTDVAATLAAVARDDRSWGRAWHVPSTDISVRELSERIAAAADAPPPQLAVMTRTELAWAGRTDPVVAELIEMLYSFEHPDVMDSALTERTFGLTATPLERVIAETIRS